MNEDFNSINNEVNNEVNTTPIDHPINNPIERPVEPTPTITTPPKKGNGGKVVIVILIILLLGAIGYILYSNGVFGGETKETKTTEKSTKNKDKNATTEKEDEGQSIKFDFTKYEEEVAMNPVEIGTLKINNADYKIEFLRVYCNSTISLPEECNYDKGAYINIFLINSKQGILNSDLSIKEVSVLDDRYILVDTGTYGDRTPSFGDSMVILDSQNEFKQVKDVVDSRVYDGYVEDNGKGAAKTRTIGYVDSNTFTYGTFEEISSGTECSQRYIEYTVKVKDGKFTKEKTFTKDGVQCSAQCS